MKNFPLLKFEVFPTCPCKFSFIEIIWIRMLKISRKVASGIWHFIGFISNQEVISSAKSGAITLKATNCFVFQWLY